VIFRNGKALRRKEKFEQIRKRPEGIGQELNRSEKELKRI